MEIRLTKPASKVERLLRGDLIINKRENFGVFIGYLDFLNFKLIEKC